MTAPLGAGTLHLREVVCSDLACALSLRRCRDETCLGWTVLMLRHGARGCDCAILNLFIILLRQRSASIRNMYDLAIDISFIFRHHICCRLCCASLLVRQSVYVLHQLLHLSLVILTGHGYRLRLLIESADVGVLSGRILSHCQPARVHQEFVTDTLASGGVCARGCPRSVGDMPISVLTV